MITISLEVLGCSIWYLEIQLSIDTFFGKLGLFSLPPALLFRLFDFLQIPARPPLDFSPHTRHPKSDPCPPLRPFRLGCQIIYSSSTTTMTNSYTENANSIRGVGRSISGTSNATTIYSEIISGFPTYHWMAYTTPGWRLYVSLSAALQQ